MRARTPEEEEQARLASEKRRDVNWVGDEDEE